MKQTTSQEPNYFFFGSGIFFHTSLLFGIYVVLFFISYPVLINADIATTGDEAYHFRQILEFLQGRFFLYYDNVTYAGILEGLAAIPFFWIFGVSFMAFKIPSILFFGLFIWSSFILARIIRPKMAWIWLSMLLFPSTLVVNEILTVNYCNSLTFFLANLILINFYRYKMRSPNPTLNITLLGYFCGLSIYVYAYSIIYIFPLAVLICLTNSGWDSIRSKMTFQIVIQIFRNLGSGRAIFVRFLDILIICFFLAITFAYTFGGFGLDVAGVTLLQINNLHKPVLQCLCLIFIRIIISNKLPSFYANKIRSFLNKIPSESKKIIIFGIAGFLLGMAPRIISILSGDISRGGQGLDMDFLPTKIASHAVTLFTKAIPDSLDLRFPFTKLLSPDSLGYDSLWYPAITFLVSIFISIVAFIFIKKNKSTVLKMIRLQQLSFNEDLFFILFPATMFAALIVTMNGPILHYLAPMYWIVTFYASLYLTELKEKSVLLFMLLFISWAGFYTINNLNNYESRGFMEGGRVKFKTNPLVEIIDFCKTHKLFWIYADYGDIGSTYILSKGDIFAAEHTFSVRGKRWKRQLALHQDFAILLSPSPTKYYIKFLQESKITFQKKEWKSRTLLWNFKGDLNAINNLRNFSNLS